MRMRSMPILVREHAARALVCLMAVALACVSLWSAEPKPEMKPSVDMSSAEVKAYRERLHGILDRAKTQDDGIHDTCGELFHIGDASTVPHLIRVLRLFPDIEI